MSDISDLESDLRDKELTDSIGGFTQGNALIPDQTQEGNYQVPTSPSYGSVLQGEPQVPGIKKPTRRHIERTPEEERERARSRIINGGLKRAGHHPGIVRYD